MKSVMSYCQSANGLVYTSVIEWLSSPISGVFLTRLKPIEEESK